jgi:hypothetical protein
MRESQFIPARLAAAHGRYASTSSYNGKSIFTQRRQAAKKCGRISDNFVKSFLSRKKAQKTQKNPLLTQMILCALCAFLRLILCLYDFIISAFWPLILFAHFAALREIAFPTCLIKHCGFRRKPLYCPDLTGSRGTEA